MVLSLLSPFSAFANEQEALPFKAAQDQSKLELKAAIAEQIALASGGPRLHADLQDLSGDEEVAVIVHLSEKPVALERGISELAGKTFSAAQAKNIEKKVISQQELVVAKLTEKSVDFEQGFTYNTVLNGFAATIKASDLTKLLEVEGITLVEPDAIVNAFEGNTEGNTEESQEEVEAIEEEAASEELSGEELTLIEEDGQVDAAMSTSIGFLGIEKLWAEGLQGQGIKVAVLDTGIDASHPEFAGIYKGGKNFVNHDSKYSRPRAADDASETSPADRAPGTPEFNANGSSFHTDHGTHVAGTIAAIGANDYGIKGIAPKVDLYAYRVLGAYGSGSNSGIIAAIEEAVKQKMNVINLSLGGGANSETDAGSYAINNAMMAGVISVVATGNSGPNRGTMGTPATARLGIAVGNTTNPEAQYKGKINVTAGDYNYSKVNSLMGTTFGADLATQLKGEFDIVAIPGFGEAKDFEGIDVAGKVALISRGNIAFVEKIANARAKGAIATIIHNNTGTAPANVALGDAFEFIPTFDISLADGTAIREKIAAGGAKVSFGEFTKTMTTGDEVNDSSSRGPSTPNFDIKPDVTAPGTNIMSSVPRYKADFPDAVYDTAYERFTGTSMATPHIAGIAALVKQANPDWTAFDVKVALSNTATILNTTKYDVFSQGAGRVNAYAAAHPEILAYGVDEAILDATGKVVENLKGTVTFGTQKVSEKNIEVTKEIKVKDIKGNGGAYDVSVVVTKGFGDAKLTVDQSSFVLNGEKTLKLKLTASKTASKVGDEFLGYIHIKKDGKGVSLPFAVDFSGIAPVEVKNMAISETDLSFDGDGVKDTARLTFTTTGVIEPIYIELWDIQNPDGGEFEDGYIGYILAQNRLAAGSYGLNITGLYNPWDGSPTTSIPDGLYTIDINGDSATGPVGDYVGPVVVKTTKPEVEVSYKDGVLSGQITDKYIDYNEDLAQYGLDYDLNDKLSASYEIQAEGAKETVEFELEQDGSFELEIEDFDNFKVTVKDAAGNFGTQELKSEGTLSAADVSLTTQGTANLVVNKLYTYEGGYVSEVDVTNKSTFVVANEEIASVSDEGKVTPKAVGETTVKVTYEDLETTVKVTVTEAPKSPLQAKDISLTTLSTTHVVVKFVSTNEDGEEVEEDVTKDSTFIVENEEVATVSAEGKVTPKKVGETSVKVTYGDFETTIKITVTSPPPAEPDKGGPAKPTEPTTPTEPTKPDAPTPSVPVFSDVQAHWAASYIQKAAALGMIKGYEDGTFKPNAALTRSQAVSLIVRGLGLTTEEAAPFTDISKYAAETQAEIAAAYKYGIVKGNDGAFRPSDKVTRAQLALMIQRAYEAKTGKKYEVTKQAPFSDFGGYDQETINAISMLHELKIVDGNNGEFMPTSATTRAHIAKMLVNFIEGLEK